MEGRDLNIENQIKIWSFPKIDHIEIGKFTNFGVKNIYSIVFLSIWSSMSGLIVQQIEYTYQRKLNVASQKLKQRSTWYDQIWFGEMLDIKDVQLFPLFIDSNSWDGFIGINIRFWVQKMKKIIIFVGFQTITYTELCINILSFQTKKNHKMICRCFPIAREDHRIGLIRRNKRKHQ